MNSTGCLLVDIHQFIVFRSHAELFGIVDLMFTTYGIGFQEGIVAVVCLIDKVVGSGFNGNNIGGNQYPDVGNKGLLWIP